MKNPKIYTALTSSFYEDGNLNKEAMKAFVDFNVNISKIDGLYINGSTGEFPMLSLQMKKDLFKYIKEIVPKEIDLIGQIGSTSIFETIELGEYAKKLGYKKLSCITPYYFKSSFESIYKYYEKVSSVLKVDLFPYYIPFLTNVELSNDEITKILNIEYVRGIKFSSTNVQQLHEIRALNPNKLIYWGWDEMMISGLLANVDGFIGSTYALNGLNARKLVNDWNKLDMPAVNKGIISNIEIIKKIVKNGLMESVKFAITNYYSIPNGENILPTLALNHSQKKEVISLMNDLYPRSK